MKQAVCVVLRTASGSVLAISRRNDPTSWGYPGGKVDPGETNLDAVRRETYEEVGMFLKAELLIPIYCGVCTGDQDFWVTTYLYDQVIAVEQVFSAEEGMILKWVRPDALTWEKSCPFADYNVGVMDALEHFSQGS